MKKKQQKLHQTRRSNRRNSIAVALLGVVLVGYSYVKWSYRHPAGWSFNMKSSSFFPSAMGIRIPLLLQHLTLLQEGKTTQHRLQTYDSLHGNLGLTAPLKHTQCMLVKYVQDCFKSLKKEQTQRSSLDPHKIYICLNTVWQPQLKRKKRTLPQIVHSTK